MFAEAVAMARVADEGRRDRALMSIVEAGLVESSTTTFGEVLASPTRSNALFFIITEIVHGDRGARALAASPELRIRMTG
jgi:hypothetical protein